MGNTSQKGGYNMFRKTLALIMTLCLCLTALAAQAAVTADGALPIVDEPAELTIWASIPGGMDDYTNNATTKWFEEKTGVHVNWIEVANAEAATLFNTSIASGDFPDIYCRGGSGAEVLQYAEDGVIIPLNDLIEEYGYYLKQRLEEMPEVREAITAPDGNIYGFPRISYNLYGASPNKLWVYKEWLERYMEETGAEQPNTAEELEAMLLFFRDNDMNGNGDTTDEIVMTGQYNYGFDGGNPVYYLLNAFTYVPSFNGYFYINDDGEYTTEVMSDEMREGLRYANRLYEEGLIAEETFVQDLVTFRSLTTTTKDKVIVATAAAPYPFRLLTLQSGVENAVEFTDYECLEPLQRADGTTVTPGVNSGIYNIGTMGMITTACENPEVAMRWMDFFYSDEVIQYLNWGGEEGSGWEWQDVPSIGGDEKAVVSLIDATTRNAIWNPDFVGCRWTTEDTILQQADANDEVSLRVKYGKMYLQYTKFENRPTCIWCTDMDLAAEYSELHTLINDYITTSINEFVLGIRDVDSDADWQEYISTLEDMDCQRYIEVAEEYYFG